MKIDKTELAFCVELYDKHFTQLINKGFSETDSQRQAIALSFEDGIKCFGIEKSNLIWRHLESAHVKRKSGALIDSDTLSNVKSSFQSWNKSSGHAFEESFCNSINKRLKDKSIKVFLQKEISLLIDKNLISNDTRDLDTIIKWINSSAFDAYIISENAESIIIFGVVQLKTSIRDRVTRDREPSKIAIDNFFLSIAVALDGAFLKLPKFSSMVNGNSDLYESIGWHGMYAYSECQTDNRIYLIDENYDPLINHLEQAEQKFLKQRQWIDSKWKPE